VDAVAFAQAHFKYSRGTTNITPKNCEAPARSHHNNSEKLGDDTRKTDTDHRAAAQSSEGSEAPFSRQWSGVGCTAP
jgi:hypothetical protein